MKVKFPEYYKNFACIADRCTDNCCIGWEIDVDAQTREKYRFVRGALGEKMKERIADGKDSSHFILCGERCPFLNGSNLCDIIMELGETSIPDICRLHPRYFSRFGEAIYGGIGLCCEVAAELILSESGEHTYREFDFDDVFDEDYDEDIFKLICGKKQSLVDILADNDSKIGDKLKALLFEGDKIQAEIDGFDASYDIGCCITLCEYFESMEHLDGELMTLLKGCVTAQKRALTPEEERYVSNFAIYFIDRYFCEGARDGDIIGKIALTLLSSAVFALLLMSEPSTSPKRAVHIAKCYSKEIEYSEENVARIMTENEALYLAREIIEKI